MAEIKKKSKGSNKSMPFKSKIPTELWATVMGWHASGLTYMQIVDKLNKEHKLDISIRPLLRLMKQLRIDKQAEYKSVVAERTHAEIRTDFSDLALIESNIYTIISSSFEAKDWDTHNKTVDRALKIKALKFAINKDNEEEDPEAKKERLLDHLFNGLAGRSK